MIFFSKSLAEIKNVPIFALTTTNQTRFLKLKKREISSVGSEHLPYKQGVTGSNPVFPTQKASQKCEAFFCYTGFSLALGTIIPNKTKHT